MVKPISQKLSEMSARAKTAEDHVKVAQKETHDKVLARRDQSRGAVEAAVKKVDQDIRSAGNTVDNKWRALQAKIAADREALKTEIAERKHDRDVKRSEDRAAMLEWEASIAVDYAMASIEQAELAVLDAIVGRVEVERAKSS